MNGIFGTGIYVRFCAGCGPETHNFCTKNDAGKKHKASKNFRRFLQLVKDALYRHKMLYYNRSRSPIAPYSYRRDSERWKAAGRAPYGLVRHFLNQGVIKEAVGIGSAEKKSCKNHYQTERNTSPV